MKALLTQSRENPSPAHPQAPPKLTQSLPKTRCPHPKGKKNPSKKSSIGDYSRFPGHLSPNPTAPSQTPHKTPPKVNHSSGKKFFSLTASFLGCCSTGWVCSPGAGECSTPSTNNPAFAKGSTGSYVVQEAEEKHPQFGVVWAVKCVPCWLVHLPGTERVPWHPGGKQGGRGRRLRRCWQGK